jgi:DNA-binding response OmpR family regulator
MKAKVLLADDDPHILSVLGSYLRARGFHVDCACEREEAEALLANVNYSVLITDLALTLAGAEGFDLLRTATDLEPRPKVIVLTGHRAAEVESEARCRGADFFVCKPVPLKVMADLTRAAAAQVRA